MRRLQESSDVTIDKTYSIDSKQFSLKESSGPSHTTPFNFSPKDKGLTRYFWMGFDEPKKHLMAADLREIEKKKHQKANSVSNSMRRIPLESQERYNESFKMRTPRLQDEEV
mmetsp:Transcript_25297/g.24683  ORF Transcript_25297/g.24683 Transcript_25297/m.24683 type:complete len:112 (+) Transcript_25297:224-559(+)